jgi:hypothetical protein
VTTVPRPSRTAQTSNGMGSDAEGSRSFQEDTLADAVVVSLAATRLTMTWQAGVVSGEEAMARLASIIHLVRRPG